MPRKHGAQRWLSAAIDELYVARHIDEADFAIVASKILIDIYRRGYENGHKTASYGIDRQFANYEDMEQP